MDTVPVQYVTTNDGYSIAYSARGEGRPLVLLPRGAAHVQLASSGDLRFSEWLRLLADRFRLVEYDNRGQGMSTRPLKPDHVFADFETDLEAVMRRLEIDGAILVAYFYSAHVAVRYAVHHPERLSALVLISCSISMNAWPLESLVLLAERNWEMLLLNFVPPTFDRREREELLSYFRGITSREDWLISHRALAGSDVAEDLPRVQTPTLVLHPRDFLLLPQDESAKVAAAIPKARFQLINGSMPMGNADEGVAAIETFLASIEEPALLTARAFPATAERLSRRELAVLRLLAAGKSNQQIADELVVSINTVKRHVSNVYDKTGVANRAQAAIHAREQGLI